MVTEDLVWRSVTIAYSPNGRANLAFAFLVECFPDESDEQIAEEIFKSLFVVVTPGTVGPEVEAIFPETGESGEAYKEAAR